MSTLEELDDLDRRGKEVANRDTQNGDQDMRDNESDINILDEEILGLSTQDILTRKRLLENDSRIMKSELSRLSHEKAAMGEKIKDNVDKIANNKYAFAVQSRSWHFLTLLQTASLSRWQCCGVA